MSRLRTVGLVAGFELYESLRSRKALALILIYVLIAAGATALFAGIVNELTAAVMKDVGPEAVDRVLESPAFQERLGQFVGDDALAAELLRVPLLALFYLWVITAFMPLIMVLTASDAISNKLASGSARFALFRVDRAGWALGILAGQAALMAVGILAGALVCWGIGVARLDRVDVVASLLWLLRMSLRGSFYGFAYLGIALCASQLVRSNAVARGLALMFAFASFVAGQIFNAMAVRDASSTVGETLHKLVPSGHATALFRPELTDRSLGMLGLFLIGLAWFGLGFWQLWRRDA
ncbi:MAG: ABC transporter permease subunit [Myxococcota bacterium]